MIGNHESLEDMSLVEHGTFRVLTDTVYTESQQQIALDLLMVHDYYPPADDGENA